ncbi:hypothetical protein AML91_15660 [Paenibacillus jilunlii]|uniref:Uncharacterized protein n=1 Tax=Paenibacillus jilunlii TaxID=682956 RepID=A0ABR5STS1_9BACL|nr:hypothetical protein AML91_15660 [Paenibacillus jilunlii]
MLVKCFFTLLLRKVLDYQCEVRSLRITAGAGSRLKKDSGEQYTLFHAGKRLRMFTGDYSIN